MDHRAGEQFARLVLSELLRAARDDRISPAVLQVDGPAYDWSSAACWVTDHRLRLDEVEITFRRFHNDKASDPRAGAHWLFVRDAEDNLIGCVEDRWSKETRAALADLAVELERIAAPGLEQLRAQTLASLKTL